MQTDMFIEILKSGECAELTAHDSMAIVDPTIFITEEDWKKIGRIMRWETEFEEEYKRIKYEYQKLKGENFRLRKELEDVLKRFEPVVGAELDNYNERLDDNDC